MLYVLLYVCIKTTKPLIHSKIVFVYWCVVKFQSIYAFSSAEQEKRQLNVTDKNEIAV